METEELGRLAVELAATWGLRVVGAVVFLAVGWAAARWLARAARGLLDRSAADATLVPFLSGLVYWLAMAFVIVGVLGLFGIPTASLVALLGAAGLAVGLALQGSLASFAAGVLLLVFRFFRAGDVVEVAGTKGRVREVGIFSTLLDTPDNVEVVVPNSEILGSVIRNYSGNDTRRIDLVVGVGYDDDLGLAARTIEGVLAEHPGVLEEPEPVVALDELGTSSVNFVVRPWVRSEAYWEVRWALLRRFKEGLEAAGCQFPYPQHDVHLFHGEGTPAVEA